MTDVSSTTQTSPKREAERAPPPPPPPRPAPVDAQQRARDAEVAAAVDRVERARPGAFSAVRSFRAEPAQPGRARRTPAVPERAQRERPEVSSTERAAQQGLRETRPVPSSDPVKKHVDDVRARLDREGLPSRAPGVRVVVNDNGEHGRAVVRAAVGDVGPGRGAEAHLMETGSDPAAFDKLGLDERTVARLDSIGPVEEKLEKGEATIDQLAEAGVNMHEATVHQHRAELGRIRELAQRNPGKPTVANMSWGASTQQTVMSGDPSQPGLAERAVQAPPGSPLHQELTKALGHAPGERDVPAVARMIAERMQRRIDDPVHGQPLRDAKAALGRELGEAADKDRVHVVVAAANQHDISTEVLGDARYGSNVMHDVPNHITVGAAHVGHPTKPGDERLAPFSSDGDVEVAAPGVQSPVGPRDRNGRPQRWDGTSFAAPYVAGTVALMLQANPNLTSAQIREVLQGTARDIPNTRRDGAGFVDPVAAVRRARELAAR